LAVQDYINTYKYQGTSKSQHTFPNNVPDLGNVNSEETTQWYSSLLQNGSVPEESDIPCVRLQAPMAPGNALEFRFGEPPSRFD